MFPARSRAATRALRYELGAGIRNSPALRRKNVRTLPSTTVVTVAGSDNVASRLKAETRRRTGGDVSTVILTVWVAIPSGVTASTTTS
jgi:hypothetical protein